MVGGGGGVGEQRGSSSSSERKSSIGTLTRDFATSRVAIAVGVYDCALIGVGAHPICMPVTMVSAAASDDPSTDAPVKSIVP